MTRPGGGEAERHEALPPHMPASSRLRALSPSPVPPVSSFEFRVRISVGVQVCSVADRV